MWAPLRPVETRRRESPPARARRVEAIRAVTSVRRRRADPDHAESRDVRRRARLRQGETRGEIAHGRVALEQFREEREARRDVESGVDERGRGRRVHERQYTAL